MNDEIKRSIDEIERKLTALQAANKEALQVANKEDTEFRTKLDNLRRQIAITSGPEMPSATDERWKLDVNERYQKAVGTVISLSTAALGSPIIFLKDIHANRSILDVLTFSAYMGGILLAVSIVCGVVYYFFSAKWVKLALVKQADFFWIRLGNTFVESVLDATYFVMLIGFLAGVYFMLQFMATYVPK